ncbi:helix-turn-helix transcriptional regulator [Sporomusa sp. KB1]|jgi:transcriptional regulator with XRE-family HTH domain|uniref:helix-turn-helix domain-containing protein n=1 Tax=Sporomusa sp. KB1 TaxID=943346 RepID=UPI0011A4E0D7|nr:helix-turn-helix transcriptional regulator [Sporomusa sp. KB1]TWH49631.1 helix-turn-helix protein [Sporomusa sp. KB1]
MAIVKFPDINRRVKEVRLYFNLKQGEFAHRIGIKQSSLSSIENIAVNVSDRVIKDIYSGFDVSETWLRTGEGNMFVDKAETALTKAAELLKLDDIEQRFLSAYLSLDQEQRQNFKEFWRQIAVAYNSQDEIAATVVTRPAVSDKKLTRAQKEELMKQQLDAEEKREMLLASTTINGFGKMA